jgi:hypothetical protein
MKTPATTYRVEIVTEIAPDGNPDGAKYENKTFAKYDDAASYALHNLERDRYDEIHLFWIDEEGDIIEHKTEIFSSGRKELGDIASR